MPESVSTTKGKTTGPAMVFIPKVAERAPEIIVISISSIKLPCTLAEAAHEKRTKTPTTFSVTVGRWSG